MRRIIPRICTVLDNASSMMIETVQTVSLVNALVMVMVPWIFIALWSIYTLTTTYSPIEALQLTAYPSLLKNLL
jgi:hypothetical protein